MKTISPNKRILIVDDNADIHADFKKILSPSSPDSSEIDDLKSVLFDKKPDTSSGPGFNLSSAFQGSEAIEKVTQAFAGERPFAVAFVDVRMPPGIDGIETVTQLWKTDPDLQIVLCTAYSDYSWDDINARFAQSDSLVVLKKPFDNVEVLQLAHALTKKWQLTQQARIKLNHLEQMVEDRTRTLQASNEALARSEERFAKAFQASPLASAILRLSDKTFIDANAKFFEITGYEGQDIIGRTHRDLKIWETPRLAEGWFERLANGEPTFNERTNIHSRSGGLNEVIVSCTAITFEGQLHMLLLAQDVSEISVLERRLRQVQSRLTVYEPSPISQPQN